MHPGEIKPVWANPFVSKLANAQKKGDSRNPTIPFLSETFTRSIFNAFLVRYFAFLSCVFAAFSLGLTSALTELAIIFPSFSV